MVSLCSLILAVASSHQEGSIVDFVTMAVAAPALECHYSGLFMVNPGTEYVMNYEKNKR